MFGRKKMPPPDRPFPHEPDCKIVKVDPAMVPPWNEGEDGLWTRDCVCTKEYWREPATPRERRDPRDPALSRHLGQCEFASETDPAVLRLALKVQDGASEGYWWVTCSGCDTSWQVLHYAESVVGAPR
jgi:hypothetical protein